MLPPGVPFLVTDAGLETVVVPFLINGAGLETGGVTVVPGDELEAVEVGAAGVGAGSGEGSVPEVSLLHLGVSLDFELRGNLFFVGLNLLETWLPICELETISSPKSISNNVQRSVNSADSVSWTFTSPGGTIVVSRNNFLISRQPTSVEKL